MAGSKGRAASGGGISRWLFVAAGLVAIAAALITYRTRGPFKSPVLSPLKAPKLTELAEFDAAYKDQMLWGSYRSGLYFGMRTRTPKALLSGLLWFDPDDPNTLNEMRARHEASHGDRLTSYGWKKHDGRTYGTQQLIDGEYNITLSMLKSFSPESGPGGDWSVRLQLGRTSGLPGRRRRISVVMYLGDEDTPREPWQVLPEGEVGDLRGGPVTLLSGASSALGRGAGRWALHALESGAGSSRSRGCRLDYLSMGLEQKGYLLRVKELMLSTMWERLERQPSSNRFRLYLPNGATTSADLALFQVTCVLPATVDFAFTSSSSGGSSGAGPAAWSGRLDSLLGGGLEGGLAEQERRFDERFDRVFGEGMRRGGAAVAAAAGEGDGGSSDPEAASPSASPSLPEGTLEVSRAALSNLLGSAGYFYGSSLVRTGGPESDPQPYWPAPLFSAVPSRSFFPRGFLWDEGFHQLLVQKWDPQLSRDMIAHWLDLMNTQGWIPREQILGEEARSRVPSEFVVQNPSHANPPSLFLPIAKMAAQLVAAAERSSSSSGGSGSSGAAELPAEEAQELQRVSAFLRRAWPRLEAWYNWFNTTQAGPLPGTFRWHGRDPAAASELNPKTLTSGLDDYPRASHPDDSERHLDLRCWLALAAKAMYDIGSSLQLPAPAVARYRAAAEQLGSLGPLRRLHFDEGRGWFADWGTHTEEVELEVKSITVPGAPGQPPQRRDVSTRVTKGWPLPQFVPQFGYVSLFPLIMELLPTGEAVHNSSSSSNNTAAAADDVAGGQAAGAGGAELTLQQLALLQDPNLLWSPSGLRSLAATASLYKKRNTADDPPYWRGQIWININYLVLRALSHYAAAGGEVGRVAAAAHDELRARLLTTLVGNYQRNGYLYEQYDDETGRGMSSHPFTGWTALVTLIAAQEY
ncbi:hypothetical protein Agub_g9131 [Astrephomene gubernaculifera]|uniref:Mannosyl-oligosaccharide glucosidase n=1 Tax=Astrephomene gubernaculifera TaxID=47775 RepID=A0AAD3DSQ5_9CHLO|nr:hypothetical protein Agub_g9131 [Astrephomene gubernaculifera]